MILPDHAVNFTVFSIESISFLFPNNYFGTDNILYKNDYKKRHGQTTRSISHFSLQNPSVFCFQINILHVVPIIIYKNDSIFFRLFASVMARSPIPKKPPAMDLTLTLVSELSIHVKNQLAGLKIDIQSVLKLGKTCGASRTKVLLQLLRFSQISSTSQKYTTIYQVGIILISC